MDERERRVEAVTRFLRGEPAAALCRALGRSRRWLYKWLRRYEPGDPGWARSRSRAPKRIPHKTPEAVVQLVCAIRKRLVTTRYAQRGAVAIQWHLQQLGTHPLPPIWTINRILKRHSLVGTPPYTPRGTPYPARVPRQPNDLHQLDLVGPRYLQGGSRCYGLHLIDAFSNAVALAAVPSKRDTDVVEAVVAAWHRLGVPRALQVDNELSFRGSNRYPRSFGLLIRLCLYLGVEVIFIPDGEPWRNGVVERFNDVYDKHRYAKLGQRAPWEIHTAIRRRRLPRRFALHQRRLPFREGRVSFVRLTDAQGRVRFFSESFLVDAHLVHEYVTGTVFTRPGLLKFSHQGRIIKIYRYRVTKP